MGRVVFGVFAAVFLVAATAQSQELAGLATAVNADHLEIGGVTFALFGVDAPEPDQAGACYAGRRFYGCYDNALRQLETLLSYGPVTCTPAEETGLLGVPYMICTAFGEDIGEEMVLSGFAFAFRQQTDMYVEAEESARAASVGLWQPGIRFDLPWDWRVLMGRPVGP